LRSSVPKLENIVGSKTTVVSAVDTTKPKSPLSTTTIPKNVEGQSFMYKKDGTRDYMGEDFRRLGIKLPTGQKTLEQLTSERLARESSESKKTSLFVSKLASGVDPKTLNQEYLREITNEAEERGYGRMIFR